MELPLGERLEAWIVTGGSAADSTVVAALQVAGLHVLPVREGDLLAAPRLDPPALLVLDDPRPRRERETAQLRLRSHPALFAVPVIVLSDDCGIDSFGGAIACGASVFVRKPADAAELTEAARRLSRWREPEGRGVSRRGTRRPLLLAVDVDAPGHRPMPGRILDASATGCRLELPVAVPGGILLGIVPRSCFDSTEIRLAGHVRWSRGVGAGAEVAVRWTGTARLLAARLLGTAPSEPR